MGKRIQASFIEELSAQSDLVELIQSRLPLKKKGSQFWACCPFHQENTPSFSVDPQKNFYHCFGCGAHGDALRFLMDFHHYSFVESVEALAAQQQRSIQYEESTPRQQAGQRREQWQQQRGLQCLQAACEWFQAQLQSEAGQAARDYLRQRGISAASIQRFALGFAPGRQELLQHLGARFPLDVLLETGLIARNERGEYYDYFRQRLMFPIHNVRGEVIAFGARALDQSQPKYLNSPESAWFNKRQELYGLHQALQQRQARQSLLVTEGYLDVISLHQHGFVQATAALGTALGEAHIQQLQKRSEHLYFAFDGDAAGQKAAARALEALLQRHHPRSQGHFVFLPAGEDPDSLLQKQGAAAFEALLQQALSPSQFLCRVLDDGLGDGRHAEAKMQLLQKLQQWLDLLPADAQAYRHLLQDELRQYFKIDAAVPIQSVGARRSASPPRASRLVQKKEHLLISMLAAEPAWAESLHFWHYPRALAQEMPLFWQLLRYLKQGENPDACLRDFLEREQLQEKLQQHWQQLEALPRSQWHQTMIQTLEDSAQRCRSRNRPSNRSSYE